MRTAVRVILVAVPACALGCARSDWIDRTLVTVDVTGVWQGSASTAQGSRWFEFTLEQQGAQVKGFVPGQAAISYLYARGTLELRRVGSPATPKP